MTFFKMLSAIVLGVVTYILTQAILNYITPKYIFNLNNTQWGIYTIHGISLGVCLIVVALILKK
ncbi:hypothetical protein C289_2639 [Anoxybacillus ayderensis]|jgi:hypothetical protein|nr:hypothetical protein AF2641_05370 [Anoxybacillus flavithermus]EPZ37333.1 hypothetical protein C289_2639 [Anoxybacillus ayderensis]